MPKKINRFSLASRGLKHKLKVSFCLMSILPLLVCIYLVANYIFAPLGFKIDISASIVISVLIAAGGFFLIKEVFDRVMSVTREAKLIAIGDINRKLTVDHTDEIGELSDALNQLTQRIRGNMDELKNYSEKTTEINLEIQKRVIVLSSLLQISSLISQGAKLEDILKTATEKSRLLVNSDVSYLFFKEEGHNNFSMRVVDGIDSAYLMAVKVDPDKDLFSKSIKTDKPFILDKQNLWPQNSTAAFYDKFKLKSTLGFPVYLKGKIIAILGIGNTEEPTTYKKDDIELLDVFAKQIAIAVDNDILMHRLEKLEIKDALTGLYNEGFIRLRLQEEIERAINCQRPCAFILIDVDNFKKFERDFGLLEAESILKKIASSITDSISEIDRPGRIGDDEFGIILPEKNKRQAEDTAEKIRQKIESFFTQEADVQKRITISGGVSENPLDGINSDQLVKKARESLELAKKQGKNRIVGLPMCPLFSEGSVDANKKSH